MSSKQMRDTTKSFAPKLPPGQKDKIDLAVIAICILALALGGYALFDGSFLEKSETHENLKSVGKLSVYSNDVRHKSVRAISWKQVGKGEQVFEGDSVFTGDGSEAQIEIGDGHIDVKEKSLVVVSTHKGHLEVNLAYGGFSSQLSANQSITVIDNGVTSEISGSAGDVVEVVHSQTAKPKIQVSKSITLIEPAQGFELWTEGKTNLHFSWTGVAGFTNYQFELASDPSFNKIISKKSVAGTETDISGVDSLNPKLYWRVKASSEEQRAKSSVRHLLVHADVGPDLMIPKDRQVTLIDTQTPGHHSIGFRWQDRSSDQDFVLQVASDPEFKNLVIEQKTQNHTFETDQILPGTYFWRVSGSSPTRQTGRWSLPRSLSVIDTIHPLPPAALEQAQLHYILPRPFVTKTPSNINKYARIGAPAKNSPNLNWTPLDKATDYKIDLALNKNFTGPQINAWQKSTSYHFSNLKPGFVYWRVQARDQKGTLGKISAIGVLQTDLPSPAPLDSVVDPTAKSKKMQVTMEWAPLLFASSYELQLADNMQMQKAKDIQIRSAKTSVVFAKSNSYFWRVRALDENKNPISEFSSPSKAELRPPPVLAQKPAPEKEQARTPASPDPNAGASATIPVPVLHEPLKESKLIAFGRSPMFVTLKWKPIHGISKYRVQISDTPDFSHELANQTTPDPRLLVNSQLPSGQLFWRVRAETPDQAFSLWSTPYQFEVQFK